MTCGFRLIVQALREAGEPLWMRCADLAQGFDVLSDGRLVSCCRDAGGRESFADMKRDTLPEALTRHRGVRRAFAAGLWQLPSCSGCAKFSTASATETLAEAAPFIADEIPIRTLVFESSSLCNLRCVDCQVSNVAFSKARVQGGRLLDFDRFGAWIEPVQHQLRLVRSNTFGEPLTHPDVLSFIGGITRENKDVFVEMSTNILPLVSDKRIFELVRSGVSLLRISMHGPDQETAARYMSKYYDIEKAIKIIRRIKEVKREIGADKPEILLTCVLFEWNDSDENLNAFRALAKDLGVRYAFGLAGPGSQASLRFPPESPFWDELQQNGETESYS